MGLSVLAVVIHGNYAPANCLTDGLLGQTVALLPAGIAHIETSIRSIDVWGTGLLAMATTVALPAVALLLRNEEPNLEEGWDEEIDQRSLRLRHITFVLAGALVASYLAAHFHLGLGENVLKSVTTPSCLNAASDPKNVLAPPCPDQLGALSAYGQLRRAAEVYWSVITSLALACLYFPAATVLWFWRSPSARANDPSPVLTLLGRLVAVLSPLLAGGIVGVIGEVLSGR